MNCSEREKVLPSTRGWGSSLTRGRDGDHPSVCAGLDDSSTNHCCAAYCCCLSELFCWVEESSGWCSPYIDMWAGTPRLVPGANHRFVFSADRFARLSTVKFDFPLNNYWPSFDDIKTSGKRVGQRDVHMHR